MGELQRQVRRAAVRLNVQLFFECLLWCWTVALAVWAAILLGEKLFAVAVAPAWSSFAALTAAAVIVAGLLSLLFRYRLLDAAVTVDRVFGLKERLSTALAMPPWLRDTPAGLAVLRDAARHAERLDVSQRIRFRLPRYFWLPLVPAAVAVLVATLVPELSQGGRAEAKPVDAKEAEQVQKVVQLAKRKLELRRKEAAEKGLSELEELMQDLIKDAQRELGKSKQMNRVEALSKLHKLEDVVQQRRKNLSAVEKMQRQLAKLQAGMARDAVSQLAQALRRGDFKQAAKLAKQLADKLRQKKLTAEERKKLAQQLKKLRQQLKKLAELEQRRKQLKKAGLPPGILEKELKKLAKEAAALKPLADVSEMLSQCQKAMAAGDSDQAAAALEEMMQKMTELGQQLEQLDDLDSLLEEFDRMRNAMVCPQCGGAG